MEGGEARDVGSRGRRCTGVGGSQRATQRDPRLPRGRWRFRAARRRGGSGGTRHPDVPARRSGQPAGRRRPHGLSRPLERGRGGRRAGSQRPPRVRRGPGRGGGTRGGGRRGRRGGGHPRVRGRADRRAGSPGRRPHVGGAGRLAGRRRSWGRAAIERGCEALHRGRCRRHPGLEGAALTRRLGLVPGQEVAHLDAGRGVQWRSGRIPGDGGQRRGELGPGRGRHGWPAGPAGRHGRGGRPGRRGGWGGRDHRLAGCRIHQRHPAAGADGAAVVPPPAVDADQLFGHVPRMMLPHAGRFACRHAGVTGR